ncbi:MAG: radical SAM protein, partial [Candidatus Aenigmarchaeota archaeon]|nr:radical SAM protein [Candidatus Aenigmarchaeota archaeon]
MNSTNYFSLNEDCSLKMLEYPAVFNKKTEELYKLNDGAMQFIAENQNIESDRFGGEEFFDYLAREQIYNSRESPVEEREFSLKPVGSPSLRYLLMHLTTDCNLKCKHCYHGDPKSETLSYDTAKNVLDEMQDMQGLTVLLSGGEAMCYENFWKINDILPDYDMNFVLLTNGTKITEENAKKLNLNKVQVSLDGLKNGHDFMRGEGSYEKTINGIRNLKNAGKDVGIATMIHKNNINEFEMLEKLLFNYGINDWIVSAPFAAGRWEQYTKYSVDIETGSSMKKRYEKVGEGPHRSSGDYACGTHLLTIMADGTYASCALMEDRIGNVNDMSLEEAWDKKEKIKLSELEECSDCESLKVCKGGCRYNAQKNGDSLGVDPIA